MMIMTKTFETGSGVGGGAESQVENAFFMSGKYYKKNWGIKAFNLTSNAQAFAV